MYKKVIEKKYYLPSDALVLNTSLLARILEYVKETPALTDEALHKLVEVASAWNDKYEVLNMDCYSSLISGTPPA
jgi:hypothetical protein